ncbi:hypothetical protein [Streptomyces sp. KR80]|uniref:hypothetical protein n=1 Tax=Streptomyces sp. KR80 TaxID=3457426 RepID=UPI003FCF686F
MPDRRRSAALSVPLPTAPSWGSPCRRPGDVDPRQGGPGPAALPGATVPLRVPSTMLRMPSTSSRERALAEPLLRERRSSSSASRPPESEDNPFAPPPEDRPDQPWRPRSPYSAHGRPDEAGPDGQDGDPGGGDHAGPDSRDQQPDWGGKWSSRQPGRHDGDFGTGPGGGRRQNGGKGPDGNGGPGGLRWDPTDPLQRRARYALLAGMWGFFFALFSLPEIALLLGALAMYWGVSSLRGKPARTSAGSADAAATEGGAEPGRQGRTPWAGPGAGPGAGPAGNSRPQTTSAVSGLVTGGLALAIVAATFTFQIVYRDYYACVEDALTQPSRQSCEKLLPEQLRPLLSTQE